jgi:hypothetical protein
MIKNFLLLALVLAAAGPVWADQPSGTISFEVDSLPGSTDMRIGWVNGVLNFQGKPHTFKMKGLRMSVVGVRNFSAIGDVYNLKAPPDLAGTYHYAAPAGISFLDGERGLVIQNDKGVVINFRVVNKRLVGMMRTILKREYISLDLMPEGLSIEQVQ